MRKAAKRDSNERAIIAVAEALGASVVQINQENLPDLLVGFQHLQTRELKNILVEVKSDVGKFTPGQLKFFAEWRGQRTYVRSKEEMFVLLWKEMGWSNMREAERHVITNI